MLRSATLHCNASFKLALSLKCAVALCPSALSGQHRLPTSPTGRRKPAQLLAGRTVGNPIGARRCLATSASDLPPPRHGSGSSVTLAYEKFDGLHPSQPPLVIAHGLFGSKRNWRSVAKALAQRTPVSAVYPVDLRNHGESPHTQSMSYPSMAEDLSQLFRDLKLSQLVLLGHSMGGKASMHLALEGHPAITKLIVLDIAPVALKPNTTFDDYIEAMQQVAAARPRTHSEAERILAPNVPESSVRKFLLTNFRMDDDGLTLTSNLETIGASMNDIWAFPYARQSVSFSRPTLFLRGGLSDYILPDVYPDIRQLFSQAKIETIEGAGHWVHAEKPAEFIKAVGDFLER
ncbi:alpha/beta-hydrolase [Gonapodya prolifera JEL478]|uniref:Alpha/beta-hydrolase n=1 Tax=Gonapodya prolifera (strain JEL478) TaxID=1344416 RepID=A0A139A736_GONPJ|nr:alpha/beta-hydrolase [Gonapodya prolifera JEL478]|eukprot:KXS12632.1 alpha/beta-hydrolase [Gonapodya prolifera JEL478]